MTRKFGFSCSWSIRLQNALNWNITRMLKNAPDFLHASMENSNWACNLSILRCGHVSTSSSPMNTKIGRWWVSLRGYYLEGHLTFWSFGYVVPFNIHQQKPPIHRESPTGNDTLTCVQICFTIITNLTIIDWNYLSWCVWDFPLSEYICLLTYWQIVSRWHTLELKTALKLRPIVLSFLSSIQSLFDHYCLKTIIFFTFTAEMWNPQMLPNTIFEPKLKILGKHILKDT